MLLPFHWPKRRTNRMRASDPAIYDVSSRTFRANVYCDSCGFRAGWLAFATRRAVARGYPCPRCEASSSGERQAGAWLVRVTYDRTFTELWSWTFRTNGLDSFGGSVVPAMNSYEATLAMVLDTLRRRGVLAADQAIPPSRLVVEPIGGAPRARPTRRSSPAARSLATAR